LEIIMNPSEISSVYWIPCEYLIDPGAIWDPVPFDISKHISSRTPRFITPILSAFCGQVLFFGIDAPIEYRAEVVKEYESGYIKKYPIWGLTLWMTSDLLCLMGFQPIAHKGRPRYSALDVDWVISILSGKKRTLETFLLRDKIGFGLSTVHAVRFAVTLGLTIRVVMLYHATRWSVSCVRRLCSL
jgi:hypothetical protein